MTLKKTDQIFGRPILDEKEDKVDFFSLDKKIRPSPFSIENRDRLLYHMLPIEKCTFCIDNIMSAM